MKLFFALLLAIAGSALAEKVSYKNYKVYKITPKNDQALQALRNLDEAVTEFSRFQFWESPSKLGRNATLMVAPEMQESMENMFEDLDIHSQVMIENVQDAINRESPRNARNIARIPVDWTDYNTLDEINEWLESLAVEFPDVITILKPGKSHLGRDIVAVNNYILNDLLRNETNRWLAANYTWYFFPVMNPDGFAYSHEVNRMWRKTRTRYNIFCYGADPNRNWAYQWMNGGSSQNPCSEIYAGPRAFSEPSVDVMKDFIASVAENMVAYIDFHSFSQMLLLPFGHTTDPLMNYDEMMEIAEVALEELRQVHGTEYVWGNIAETIYIASGSSMDWVKGEFEVPIAYTYELRDRGLHGFILPADQILPTAEETLVSLLSIFRQYRERHPDGLKLKNKVSGV
ncbi:hypothetical protein HUJ04_008448 [Dendroctonus ponderosae]|nr:hypothetical protein HUJ04_008448 [Dendroctonus ponderosae]KAH1002358.1 hypothetical protein HUJ04_008448 [Dendroctonus ponderosae]